MSSLVRNAVAEFVGTFIFAFAVVGAVNSGSPLTPLAIGFVLMVMVFATGHISGAHLNPAVSVGVWLRGAINLTGALVYIVAQLVAAALAAALSFVVWPAGKEPMKIDAGPAFLVEALWTLVLVYVVLNVATSKDHPNNSFYGLAIGSTVFVGAVAVGAVSGGGFNPAIALGLAVTGHFAWGSYWLYFIAPIVGAAIAALIFRALNTHDKLPAKEEAVSETL
ncbi:MAG: aquaporin [Microbacterium sp.]|uniref:MIP/aquaporin family protein n=1 Tax=Microbacterium sp. TaxID=51671 RepID=UPI00092B8DDC|nr:aquaporin [Microbacterium sp.]OJU57085.1 MAG: porin [Microbacterium sp. 70-38]MBN9154244.1 aquaporin [Microbacterium sp.]MBN9175138.1 aquaporin [Microbacterium sp.]MBN9180311.1 aquaporin [Microbacterium sp.]MBN9183766.1 aquaporin [Microbacterium sp.]